MQHRNYNKDTLVNDIALIRLETPVKFNRFVKKVCLPKERNQGHFEQKDCFITGWGDSKGKEMIMHVIIHKLTKVHESYVHLIQKSLLCQSNLPV